MIMYSRELRELRRKLNSELNKVLDGYYNDTGEYPKVVSVSPSKYEDCERVVEPVKYPRMVFMSIYGEISVEMDENQLEPYKVL